MLNRGVFFSLCISLHACSGAPADFSDSGPGPDAMQVDAMGPSPDVGHADSGRDVPEPAAEARANIDFPPPSSTIAAELPFRGTATSDSAIVAVRVNGELAETEDAFAHWTALVDMEMGSNLAIVEVETTEGVVEAARVPIERFARGEELSRGETSRYGEIGHHVFPGATALAYDHVHQRVFASDSYAKGVWYVDLTTGDQFDLTRGVEGVRFNHPRDLVYAPANDRLYVVLKDDPKNVLEVNVEDGSRRILPGIEGAEDVDWNHATSELIVSSLANNTLYAFDPDTDDIRVLSSNSVGGGIEQSRYTPIQVAVDESTNRAFVTGIAYRNLLSVDLATGERSIASDAEGAFGTSDLTQWGEQREAYSQGYNSTIPLDDEAIYGVHLDTGARRRIPFGNDGITMVMARGIAAYPHGILYASVWGIFAIDPVTGARVMVSGRPVGESDDRRECLPDCTAP